MSCPAKVHRRTEKVTPEEDSLPSVMKAVRIAKFGGPDVLEYITDWPLPDCAAKQVLIKVLTVGVNPYETYIRAGTFGIAQDRLPLITGSDCAGIIVRVGSDVSKFKVGDRVYTVQTVSGSYAEYTVATECHTFHLPPQLTFSQAAALGVPYFTAYRALFYGAQCQRGETVLVHGASGAVGTACCQIARAYGLRVLATAGTDRGIEMLHENAISDVFNHTEKGYVNQIQEAVRDHGGVDIVCEMCGGKNLEKDVELLATNGRVMVIGARGKATFSPGQLFAPEARIQGVRVFNTTEAEYVEMAAALEAGAAAGWLRPVISQEYPLSAAAEAQREVVQHKHGSAGKIILSL